MTILTIFLISYQPIYELNNEEFRAVWVITWEQLDPVWPHPDNRDRICEILDNIKAANMNAVIWQVRQSGTAYYRSSYEPFGKYMFYSDPGYDPFAYAVKQAHARGLEIHAWMNVFECRGAVIGSPAYVHPEWVCRDENGNPMPDRIAALSPGLSEVREYLINVAMEIVRNYDIDGLHLDYVRWNEFTTPERTEQLKQLMKEGLTPTDMMREFVHNKKGRYLYDVEHPYKAGVPEGFDTWEDWWRWSVTEFVRVLHDSIQAVKPWVRLSAAVLGKYNWDTWQAYGRVFQDAALWFNNGYVDQLMPMHYHWTTPDGFYDALTRWEPSIQPGINEGRLYTVGPGSYKFSLNGVWANHPWVVETCRGFTWVDGFQFFSYRWWDDHQYWVEASKTFFMRKTKIRATGLIDSIPPEPPTISVSKLAPLTYEIKVTPPDEMAANCWVVIYRSPDSIIDVDKDEIVDIYFGDTTFAHVERFDSYTAQNKYFYAATAIDRYWNESPVSNIVQINITEMIQYKPIYKMTYDEIDKLLKEISKKQWTISERINFYSERFLGMPYKFECVGDGPYAMVENWPLVNLRETNCMALCEHVLAMAISDCWDNFFNNLLQIRYKDGIIGIKTRNHYTMADWLPENRWLLDDVTKRIGGKYTRTVTRTISHRKFLKNKGIEDMQYVKPDRQLTIDYVPMDVLVMVEDSVKAGDIGALIYANRDDIFSAHMVIIAEKGGRKYIREASRRKGTIDTPYEEWINTMKATNKYLGMAFMRVRDELNKPGKIILPWEIHKLKARVDEDRGELLR